MPSNVYEQAFQKMADLSQKGQEKLQRVISRTAEIDPVTAYHGAQERAREQREKDAFFTDDDLNNPFYFAANSAVGALGYVADQLENVVTLPGVVKAAGIRTRVTPEQIALYDTEKNLEGLRESLRAFDAEVQQPPGGMEGWKQGQLRIEDIIDADTFRLAGETTGSRLASGRGGSVDAFETGFGAYQDDPLAQRRKELSQAYMASQRLNKPITEVTAEDIASLGQQSNEALIKALFGDSTEPKDILYRDKGKDSLGRQLREFYDPKSGKTFEDIINTPEHNAIYESEYNKEAREYYTTLPLARRQIQQAIQEEESKLEQLRGNTTLDDKTKAEISMLKRYERMLERSEASIEKTFSAHNRSNTDRFFEVIGEDYKKRKEQAKDSPIAAAAGMLSDVAAEVAKNPGEVFNLTLQSLPMAFALISPAVQLSYATEAYDDMNRNYQNKFGRQMTTKEQGFAAGMAMVATAAAVGGSAILRTPTSKLFRTLEKAGDPVGKIMSALPNGIRKTLGLAAVVTGTALVKPVGEGTAEVVEDLAMELGSKQGLEPVDDVALAQSFAGGFAGGVGFNIAFARGNSEKARIDNAFKTYDRTLRQNPPVSSNQDVPKFNNPIDGIKAIQDIFKSKDNKLTKDDVDEIAKILDGTIDSLAATRSPSAKAVATKVKGIATLLDIKLDAPKEQLINSILGAKPSTNSNSNSTGTGNTSGSLTEDEKRQQDIKDRYAQINSNLQDELSQLNNEEANLTEDELKNRTQAIQDKYRSQFDQLAQEQDDLIAAMSGSKSSGTSTTSGTSKEEILNFNEVDPEAQQKIQNDVYGSMANNTLSAEDAQLALDSGIISEERVEEVSDYIKVKKSALEVKEEIIKGNPKYNNLGTNDYIQEVNRVIDQGMPEFAQPKLARLRGWRDTQASKVAAYDKALKNGDSTVTYVTSTGKTVNVGIKNAVSAKAVLDQMRKELAHISNTYNLLNKKYESAIKTSKYPPKKAPPKRAPKQQLSDRARRKRLDSIIKELASLPSKRDKAIANLEAKLSAGKITQEGFNKESINIDTHFEGRRTRLTDEFNKLRKDGDITLDGSTSIPPKNESTKKRKGDLLAIKGRIKDLKDTYTKELNILNEKLKNNRITKENYEKSVKGLKINIRNRIKEQVKLFNKIWKKGDEITLSTEEQDFNPDERREIYNGMTFIFVPKGDERLKGAIAIGDGYYIYIQEGITKEQLIEYISASVDGNKDNNKAKAQEVVVTKYMKDKYDIDLISIINNMTSDQIQGFIKYHAYSNVDIDGSTSGAYYSNLDQTIASKYGKADKDNKYLSDSSIEIEVKANKEALIKLGLYAENEVNVEVLSKVGLTSNQLRLLKKRMETLLNKLTVKDKVIKGKKPLTLDQVNSELSKLETALSNGATKEDLIKLFKESALGNTLSPTVNKNIAKEVDQHPVEFLEALRAELDTREDLPPWDVEPPTSAQKTSEEDLPPWDLDEDTTTVQEESSEAQKTSEASSQSTDTPSNINEDTNSFVNTSMKYQGSRFTGDVFREDGVDVIRKRNITESFGNPFGVKNKDTKATVPDAGNVEEVSNYYFNWLLKNTIPESIKPSLTDKQKDSLNKQREFIIGHIASGNLKGESLIYMPLNDDTEITNHAFKLSELINSPVHQEWRKGLVSQETPKRATITLDGRASNKKKQDKPVDDTKPKTINIYYGQNQNPRLSNLAGRPFTYEGLKYVSVEHAFQSLKNGKGVDKNTYSNKNWRAGKKIRGSRGDNVTDEFKVDLMTKLIRASLEQNPEILQLLLDTGDAILTHTQDTSLWGKAFPEIMMKLRDEFRKKGAGQSQRRATITLDGGTGNKKKVEPSSSQKPLADDVFTEFTEITEQLISEINSSDVVDITDEEQPQGRATITLNGSSSNKQKTDVSSETVEEESSEAQKTSEEDLPPWDVEPPTSSQTLKDDPLIEHTFSNGISNVITNIKETDATLVVSNNFEEFNYEAYSIKNDKLQEIINIIENEKKLQISINLNELIYYMYEKKDISNVAENIVKRLNDNNIRSLNISGDVLNDVNDIGTHLTGIFDSLNDIVITQEMLDELIQELIEKINSSENLNHKITSIRTSGETGISEAGTKAGISLNIPTITLANKNWEYTNADNKVIAGKEQFLSRFKEGGFGQKSSSTKSGGQTGTPSTKVGFTVIPKSTVPSAEKKKAPFKASKATKFIGFGIRGSSTELYAQQAKEQGIPVNSTSYTTKDVVFASVSGNASKEQITNTVNIITQALDDGALVLLDSEGYLNNSKYNKGEKEVAERLLDLGYTRVTAKGDPNVGIWSKQKKKPSESPQTPVEAPTVETDEEGNVLYIQGTVEDLNDPINLGRKVGIVIYNNKSKKSYQKVGHIVQDDKGNIRIKYVDDRRSVQTFRISDAKSNNVEITDVKFYPVSLRDNKNVSYDANSPSGRFVEYQHLKFLPPVTISNEEEDELTDTQRATITAEKTSQVIFQNALKELDSFISTLMSTSNFLTKLSLPRDINFIYLNRELKTVPEEIGAALKLTLLKFLASDIEQYKSNSFSDIGYMLTGSGSSRVSKLAIKYLRNFGKYRNSLIDSLASDLKRFLPLKPVKGMVTERQIESLYDGLALSLIDFMLNTKIGKDERDNPIMLATINKASGDALEALGGDGFSGNATIDFIKINKFSLDDKIINNIEIMLKGLNNEKLSITPNFTPVKSKIQKFRKRTLFRLTKQAVDTIKKLRKVKYYVNQDMWNIYSKFTDEDLDYIFEIEKPEDYVADLRDTIEGQNLQKINSWMNLKNFINHMIANEVIDRPVYFDWFIASNDRIHLASQSGIDFQNDKLHRFFINPGREFEVTKELRHQYKVAVLAGLKLDGYETDFGKYDSEDETLVNEMFEEAQETYGELDFNSKEGMREFVRKNGAHGLMALIALKKYDPVNNFSVRLVTEFDQVTSGASNTSLLLAEDIKLLQAAGFFDEESGFSSYMDARAQDLKDNYERVMLRIKELIKGKELPLFSLIQEFAGIDINRNFAKSPSTLFNYAAGGKRISEEQAEEIFTKLLYKVSELLRSSGTEQLNNFKKAARERINITLEKMIKDELDKEAMRSEKALNLFYMWKDTNKHQDIFTDNELNEKGINSFKQAMIKAVLSREIGGITVSALNEVFGNIIKSKETILELAYYMYKLHLSEFNEGIGIAINENDGDPLSLKEQKEIFMNVDHPAVIRAVSSTDNSDSLQLGKLKYRRTSVTSASVRLSGINQFNRLDYDKNKKEFISGMGKEQTSINVGIKEINYIEPGASAITTMMQGVDGHNMQKTILEDTSEDGITPVHDAMVVSLLNALGLSRSFNKNILLTAAGTYNPIQAIVGVLQDVNVKFKIIGLKRENGDIIQGTEYEEAISGGLAIVKKIKHFNPERLLSNGGVISSVPYPGGSFKIDDDMIKLVDVSTDTSDGMDFVEKGTVNEQLASLDDKLVDDFNKCGP